MRDKIFVGGIFTIIILLFVGIFIRGIKDISYAENRELNTFPELTTEDYLSGKFQDDLERALSDQLVFSERLKATYNEVKSLSMSATVEAIKVSRLVFGKEKQIAVDSSQSGSSEHVVEPENIEKANDEETLLPEDEKTRVDGEESIVLLEEDEIYHLEEADIHVELTPFSSNLVQIDETGQLVYQKRDKEAQKDLFQNKADNINELHEKYRDLKMLCYYVETDVDLGFIDGVFTHDIVKQFRDMVDPSIPIGVLATKQLEDYANYFFKTDHHWNVNGQRQGYEDIIHLILGEDEPLIKLETHLIDGLEYIGYKSRETGDYSVFDNFSILYGSLPEHEVYINDEPADYGKKDAYMSGDFEIQTGKNYYGDCNGFDYGLVTYDFHQEKKENLLIFVDSFSNPINEFIASHFNKTYIVDFRYYESEYGHSFDFSAFTKKNDIDIVLFSGYYFFYANDLFLVGD